MKYTNKNKPKKDYRNNIIKQNKKFYGNGSPIIMQKKFIKTEHF